MGVYRSLSTQMRCEHCGDPWLAEIQFYTGNDRCQEYQLGQIVPDLPAGSRYNGCADRYCDSCMYGYMLADYHVSCRVIEELIGTGELAIIVPTTNEHLTLEALREIAALSWKEISSAYLERRGYYHFAWPPAQFGLIWRGNSLDRSDMGSEAWESFRNRQHELMDMRMRDEGWEAGDTWLREDIVVLIDSMRQIFIEEIERDKRENE